MSVVMHLCVCPYVWNCMRKNLYLCETPIYFSNIYYLLIICYREFPSSYMCMLFNFGTEIQNIKGVHQSWFTVILVASSNWIVIV